MQTLASSRDLDAALAADTALVFKNSTTCPISAAARREVEVLLWRRPDAPLYVLDIHRAADLSADVARQSGIEHESPQMILFERGKPVWHASHYAISAAEVERALDGAKSGRRAPMSERGASSGERRA